MLSLTAGKLPPRNLRQRVFSARTQRLFPWCVLCGAQVLLPDYAEPSRSQSHGSLTFSGEFPCSSPRGFVCIYGWARWFLCATMPPKNILTERGASNFMMSSSAARWFAMSAVLIGQLAVQHHHHHGIGRLISCGLSV